ncbi:FkbM family methyltransferase [Streptomyces sp. TRM 70361]|uniref:FkbM family methyltransferase n=1 Tax=Streptomyces sp. TRM 70361 TaxID=3116553 RepID=UPI002E7BCCD7|nr:FkbM family methyltransferase [Streptomyces sp. TRM 70361]MEE1940650.1 FkbM family methyltransferase [Streptomyces sp. TRM 70361]
MASPTLTTFANGLRLYAQSPDEARFQYREIFEHGCYEGMPLPPRALVVDVGACIGMFTLYTKLRHPDARVIAFEPVAESRRALDRNIALHRLADVRVEAYGVGRTPKEAVSFTYYPRLPGNSTRYPDQKALQIAVLAEKYPDEDAAANHRGYQVTAPVDRLSRWLPRDGRVDLLKIDVEGAEIDVLEGIDADDWPRIDRVVAEVQDLDGRLAAATRLLRDAGLYPVCEPSPLVETEIRTFLVTARRDGREAV